MDNQIEEQVRTEYAGDIDEKGHLALAMFIVVVTVLLLVIFALAQAA